MSHTRGWADKILGTSDVTPNAWEVGWKEVKIRLRWLGIKIRGVIGCTDSTKAESGEGDLF